MKILALAEQYRAACTGCGEEVCVPRPAHLGPTQTAAYWTQSELHRVKEPLLHTLFRQPK